MASESLPRNDANTTESGQLIGTRPISHENANIANRYQASFSSEVRSAVIQMESMSMNPGSPKYNETQSKIDETTHREHQRPEETSIYTRSQSFRESVSTLASPRTSTMSPTKRTASISSVSNTTHVQSSDDDSENDANGEAFELKRLELFAKRANELYKIENWQKAEAFVQAIIKTLDKSSSLKVIKPGSISRNDWLLKLVDIQAQQSKWDDGLLTTKRLTKTDLNTDPSTNVAGFVEFWQSFFQYKLGNLKAARRLCKKVIKVRQGSATVVTKQDEAVNLMLQILTKEGDEVELEFYQSMLSPQKVPPPLFFMHPKENTIMQQSTSSIVNSSVETNSAHQDAHRETVALAPSLEEKRSLLEPWLLDISPNARILMASVEDLDKAITHIMQNNDLTLAEVIFGDPGKLVHVSAQEFENFGRLPPLHQAIYYNNIALVQLLIKNYVDILSLSSGGWTTLNIAIQKASSEMVKFIIHSGFPVDGTGKVNERDLGIPLHVACSSNTNDRGAKIKILLDCGANINIKGFFGRTPLMALIMLSKANFVWNLLEDMEILLARRASVSEVDDNLQTALHLAAEVLDGGGILLLLRYGASISRRDLNGLIPRDLARQIGSGSSIEKLLSP
ncbi:Ankyrin-2 [Dactylellina cionopaga]|nr:Ankyrin-2 [Dactylellina cionopaga]